MLDRNIIELRFAALVVYDGVGHVLIGKVEFLVALREPYSKLLFSEALDFSCRSECISKIEFRNHTWVILDHGPVAHSLL